jgi:beta-N-acetylhexosaminidase
MPTDPEAGIRAVVAAVESGRLKRSRIQESVAKILAAKEKVGLDRRRFVDLEAIADKVDSPEANEKAQEVAERAVTLVRNSPGLVPLAAPERTCFVVMPGSRYSSEGQVFTQEVRRRAPRAQLLAMDPSMPLQQVDETIGRLQGCEAYAVAAFAAVTASRGSVGLGGELPHAIETVSAGGKPVILVALGSPYLLRSFPQTAAYLATFSNVPPSEIAAVRALWGEIRIGGRLPVSIPGMARYGDGLQVPATRSRQGTGTSQ